MILQICLGHLCARDGRHLYAAARRYVEERSLEARIAVEPAGCSGWCDRGPNLFVLEQGHRGGPRHLEGQATPAEIPALIDRLLRRR